MSDAPRVRSRLAEEHGKINRSFWFVIISVALLGMVVIDGASIFYQRIQLEQVASDASTEAAAALGKGFTEKQALAAAVGRISNPAMHIDETTYTVDEDKKEVSFVIEMHASTVFLEHISFLKKWADIKETAVASPSN